MLAKPGRLPRFALLTFERWSRAADEARRRADVVTPARANAAPQPREPISLADLVQGREAARHFLAFVLLFNFAISSGPTFFEWESGNHWDVAVVVMTGTSTPFLLLLFLRAVARHRPGIPAWVAGIIAITLIATGDGVATFWLMGQGPWDGGPKYVERVAFAVRMEIFYWCIGAVAWYYLRRNNLHEQRVREAALAAARTEAAADQARLNLLQAQIEPHFLFNTLAHAQWLCRRDPARAAHMLEHFLHYLRAALPGMRCAAGTLGQEVRLAQAYLEIQQVRMGDKLVVQVDLPASLASLPFPPMTLITLVENAVKHGLNRTRDGGLIAIRCRMTGPWLSVEVRDNGAGLAQGNGAGIGLANLKARLDAMFNRRAMVTVVGASNGGVIATIALPCG